MLFNCKLCFETVGMVVHTGHIYVDVKKVI